MLGPNVVFIFPGLLFFLINSYHADHLVQVSFASPNEDELVAMANALSGGNVFSPIERDSSRNQCSTETLFHMLKPAVWVLLEKGIKIVVVTVGSDGVFLCSKGGPSFMRTVCKGNKSYVSNAELFKTVTASCPSNTFSNPSDSDKSLFLFAVHFPALPASVVRLTGAGDCLVGGTVASICAGLDVMQSLAVGIAASKAAVEAETNVPCVLNLATIAGTSLKLYFARDLYLLRPVVTFAYRVNNVCFKMDWRSYFFPSHSVYMFAGKLKTIRWPNFRISSYHEITTVIHVMLEILATTLT